jgi:hypothetical protein
MSRIQGGIVAGSFVGLLGAEVGNICRTKSVVFVSMGRAKPKPSRVFVTGQKHVLQETRVYEPRCNKQSTNKLTPLTTCRSNVTVGLSVMNVPSTTGTNTYVPQKAEEATALFA